MPQAVAAEGAAVGLGKQKFVRDGGPGHEAFQAVVGEDSEQAVGVEEHGIVRVEDED